MSTLSATNLKNASSASNNIVLGTGGGTTITNNLTVSGTGNHSIAGTLQFNSGYGSVATAYGCRAWVNFNGAANTNLTGTYSQSGTTVTVTATAHGLLQGSVIYADITSGTGVDGTYTVTGVTDANTFTYTAGTSLTTSGNVTLVRSTIRGSGNVSSVADNAQGDYTVNFTTAMPDANYCTVVSVWNSQNDGSTDAYGAVRAIVGQVKGASGITTGAVGVQSTITATDTSAGARGDMSGVFVAVFR